MLLDIDLFLIFLIVRIASVFVVQTFFVPDEYWQSLEVSHNIAFNYGDLTWEWTKGIRSYIPTLLFASFYKILRIIGLDTPATVINGPRVLQAVLSAYSDVYFCKWTGTRKWAAFSMATSWFWFYTASRTLINTLECVLTSIALFKFPWPGTGKEDSSKFIWIVAFLFVIRPTSAIMWIPLCVYHLSLSKKSPLNLVVNQYVPIGLSVLVSSILLDSIVHGSFVVTIYEFFKFNYFEDVASYYGVQPWHWYLSAGFPAILGIQLLPFVLATMVVIKNRRVHPNELVMLGVITFTIAGYSCIAHKEFRFLLPLLPLVLCISSRFLSAWSRKANNFQLCLVATIIFLANAVPAWYLSMVHQRGTLDVMQPLRQIAVEHPKETSLLFLMPCHSTPMYSHLHVNVTTSYLSCLPNFNKTKDYVDEQDTFYMKPMEWLRQTYPPQGALPSHIICFDSLQPRIQDILMRYKQIHKFYHTSIPLSSRVGSYVLVYQRDDFSNGT